jgi:hypothetical protein
MSWQRSVLAWKRLLVPHSPMLTSDSCTVMFGLLIAMPAAGPGHPGKSPGRGWLPLM